MSEKKISKNFISKNINFLIETYVDAIKKSTDDKSLLKNLRPILSKDFSFGNSGLKGFAEKVMPVKNNNYKIEVINPSLAILRIGKYKNKKNSSEISANETLPREINNSDKVEQQIHLDKIFKIEKVLFNGKLDGGKKNDQKGGIGYYQNVGINPIAGLPVISSYYSAARPIFNGMLLQGGGKKTNQKGGKLNTAYYLDIADNHFNVLPQYKKYEDPIC